MTTPAYRMAAMAAALDRAHREYHRARRIHLAATAIRYVLIYLAVVGFLEWQWFTWELLCRAMDEQLGLARYWA